MSTNEPGTIPMTTLHPMRDWLRKSLRYTLCLTIIGFLFLSGAKADSGIPIPNGVWTFVRTHGVPAQANGWEQLVYAPVIQQSIMLSQYHQRNSEPDESLVGYNFDTNSWDVIDVGGNFHTETMPEGGESQGFFGFNPNNNSFVYHCCTTGSNQSEDINHDWWYDVVGQSGRDKHTSPKPAAAILLAGGAFDIDHNVFIFEGGASHVGTWAYDPTGNSWQQMHPTGTLPDPSLALPGVAYSTAEKNFTCLAGNPRPMEPIRTGYMSTTIRQIPGVRLPRPAA